MSNKRNHTHDVHTVNTTMDKQKQAPIHRAQEQHSAKKTIRGTFTSLIAWFKKHQDPLKGCILLGVGLTMVFMTGTMLATIIVFLLGITCTYYGLTLLGLKSITTLVDTTINRYIKS